MQQNIEIIRGVYAAFAKGDIPTVLGVFRAFMRQEARPQSS